MFRIFIPETMVCVIKYFHAQDGKSSLVFIWWWGMGYPLALPDELIIHIVGGGSVDLKYNFSVVLSSVF